MWRFFRQFTVDHEYLMTCWSGKINNLLSRSFDDYGPERKNIIIKLFLLNLHDRMYNIQCPSLNSMIFFISETYGASRVVTFLDDSAFATNVILRKIPGTFYRNYGVF